MLTTLKVKIAFAMAALLLISGGALLGAPQRVAAHWQETPDPTQPCTAQDMLDGTEPVETVDAAETGPQTGNFEQQCGDQNAPDAQAETVNTGEQSGTETDNVQQGFQGEQQGDNNN